MTRFGRSGLYGARSGPKIAAIVASAMTAADTMPATPVPRSPDSDRERLVPARGDHGAHLRAHWARLPSETRGSSSAYSTSTSMLTTTNAVTSTSEIPCTTARSFDSAAWTR